MNQTLQNAKELLDERYRLDSNDAGAISEYNRRCATHLVYTTTELDAQLSLINILIDQIKELREKLEKLERLNSLMDSTLNRQKAIRMALDGEM